MNVTNSNQVASLSPCELYLVVEITQRKANFFSPGSFFTLATHFSNVETVFFFPDQAEMLFLEIEAGLSRASRRAACLDVAKFLSNYNLHML